MGAMRLCAVAILVFVAIPAARARADYSKAWAAAKAQLPANTKVLVVGDVAAGVKTATFAATLPLILASERDVMKGYALVADTCKIDPVAAIDGVVVAADPATKKGVIYVQLVGIDRAKFGACLEKMLAASGGKRAIVAQEGALTVLRDGRKALYLAWVAPEVVAIGFDPDDRAKLHDWIDQKGAFAKAPIGAQLAKVDTRASAWGVFALDRVLDRDVPVKAGRGTVAFGASAVACEIRGVFDTPKAARDTLGDVKKELLKGMYREKTPEPFKKLMKAIAMKAAGTEIAVTATIAEVDLIGAIAFAITD